MNNATKTAIILAAISLVATPTMAGPLDVKFVANAVCSYGAAHADAAGIYTTASASAGLGTISMSGAGASVADAFGPGPTWSASATSWYGVGTLTAKCSLTQEVPDVCKTLGSSQKFAVRADTLDAGTTTYRGDLFYDSSSDSLAFVGTKTVDGSSSPFTAASTDHTLSFSSAATSTQLNRNLVHAGCPSMTASFYDAGGRSALLSFDEWTAA